MAPPTTFLTPQRASDGATSEACRRYAEHCYAMREVTYRQQAACLRRDGTAMARRAADRPWSVTLRWSITLQPPLWEPDARNPQGSQGWSDSVSE